MNERINKIVLRCAAVPNVELEAAPDGFDGLSLYQVEPWGDMPSGSVHRQVVEEVAALGPENDREAQAYAELFVHARGDLIYLLTEVERLSARTRALERQLDGALRSLQHALAELSEKDNDGGLRYAQDDETTMDNEQCVDD